MENSFNEFESSSYETENLKLSLTVEDIREVVLPVENIEYTGEGASSYSAKYDTQKSEFLKSVGVESEGLDHAEIVTSFLIASHIGTLKYIEQTGGNLDRAVEIANRVLEDGRIDTVGFREDLGNGRTYESIRKDLGFAANADGKVSKEEYSNLLNSILNTLKNRIE